MYRSGEAGPPDIVRDFGQIVIELVVPSVEPPDLGTGDSHCVEIEMRVGHLLREDNRAIVRAASQASKAADWLLSFVPDTGEAEDDADTVAVETDRRAA